MITANTSALENKSSEVSLVAVSSSQSLILCLQYSANAASQIRLAGSANAWIKKRFGNNLLQALKAAFLQGFKNSGGQARPLNLAIVQTKGIYFLVIVTFFFLPVGYDTRCKMWVKFLKESMQSRIKILAYSHEHRHLRTFNMGVPPGDFSFLLSEISPKK